MAQAITVRITMNILVLLMIDEHSEKREDHLRDFCRLLGLAAGCRCRGPWGLTWRDTGSRNATDVLGLLSNFDCLKSCLTCLTCRNDAIHHETMKAKCIGRANLPTLLLLDSTTAPLLLRLSTCPHEDDEFLLPVSCLETIQ
jgi:hypothetical protein